MQEGAWSLGRCIIRPQTHHYRIALTLGNDGGHFLSVCLFLLFVACFVLFFKTGFLCITALAVLELAFVDQAHLELTEIHRPLPPKRWD